jgi:hypothetical protein
MEAAHERDRLPVQAGQAWSTRLQGLGLPGAAVRFG